MAWCVQGMELLKIPFEHEENLERAGTILMLNILNVPLNVLEPLKMLWKGRLSVFPSVCFALGGGNTFRCRFDQGRGERHKNMS